MHPDGTRRAIRGSLRANGAENTPVASGTARAAEHAVRSILHLRTRTVRLLKGLLMVGFGSPSDF